MSVNSPGELDWVNQCVCVGGGLILEWQSCTTDSVVNTVPPASYLAMQMIGLFNPH